jgi:hypothetical protein
LSKISQPIFGVPIGEYFTENVPFFKILGKIATIATPNGRAATESLRDECTSRIAYASPPVCRKWWLMNTTSFWDIKGGKSF